MADILTYRCSTCLGCNLQELYNPNKVYCENYKSGEVSDERVRNPSYHQGTIRQVTDKAGREDSYVPSNVFRTTVR